MIAIEHQVRGIGYGQDEARRVGDEGADEEVGERFGLGLFGGREDGGGQHDGCSVVGQEGRDHHPHAIDQEKEPLGRTLGLVDGIGGDPVEQSFPPGRLRQQHHPDEEQIDIEALADRMPGAGHREEAKHDQHDRAGRRPYRFRPAEWPDQDAERGQDGDRPDGEVFGR